MVRFLLLLALVSGRVAAALMSLFALAGCASLPKLGRTPPADLRTNAPRVMTQDGELSPARRAALLERQDKPDEPTLLERQLAAWPEISSEPLVAGNSTQLLVDGPENYARVFRAIRAARDTVDIETYILEGDELGEKLLTLLMQKEAQGVQVNLLYDALGSRATPDAFLERLSDLGVNLCEFNPILPSRGRLADLDQRDHRKQVIVDGRIAISGGINFSNVYSTGSGIGSRHEQVPRLDKGWRDTNVVVRGPAVAQFQKLFIESWQKQNCPMLAARDYFPRLRKQGDKVVGVVAASSDDAPGATYLTLLSAIRYSRQSVRLTMAYFVPDWQMRRALEDASRHGVDVALILPGFTDMRLVLDAGRSYYDELLSAGVKIYELRGALLHAKTAVIDGVWSTVGSSNLDRRSFVLNDELNTVVLGESFGRATMLMFDADLRDAVRIDPDRWRRRGLEARLEEDFARLIKYWL